MLAKLTTNALPVDAFRTDVPKQLATVVARSMCRERDKRPAVPAEVAEAFFAIFGGLPTQTAAQAKVPEWKRRT